MASQISPVWYIDFWDLCLRLGVAVVLGGLIGIERELSNHPAGFRTHILVCIGSALIMLLSIYGFSEFINEPNVRVDPARLAAQVISGIGFLGAGTIIRKGVSISGLTTAASLWATAGIGLSAGAGFYSGALLTTFLVLICLFVLNKLEKSKMMRNKEEIVFLVDDTPDVLGRIMLQLGQSDIKIKQIRVSSNDSEDGSKTIRCSVRETDEKVLEQCVSQMESVPGVREVEFTMHSKKIVFETSGDTSFKEVSRLP
jgi:Uncharacterized membrane protein